MPSISSVVWRISPPRPTLAMARTSERLRNRSASTSTSATRDPRGRASATRRATSRRSKAD